MLPGKMAGMPLYGTANVRLPPAATAADQRDHRASTQVRFNSNFHSLRSLYIKYNPRTRLERWVWSRKLIWSAEDRVSAWRYDFIEKTQLRLWVCSARGERMTVLWVFDEETTLQALVRIKTKSHQTFKTCPSCVVRRAVQG